jgi:pyruvate formate lyase activating enzyme
MVGAVGAVGAAAKGARERSRAIPDALWRGAVFNVQRYSLHDGAGIRTTVFLKGCPLRCDWCCNPESQRGVVELGVSADRCLGRDVCDYCATSCDRAALGFDVDGRPVIDRGRCDACLACVRDCPAGALTAYGEERTVAEILDEVEQDAIFHARSGGGLTLSGGEPLRQAKFALALLREARRRHIDCAIETCGHVAWGTLATAAGLVREIYFDVKLVDPVRHKRITGRTNDRILSNLVRLAAGLSDGSADKPMEGLSAPAGADDVRLHVRTPVIPGINDTVADIDAILDLLAPYPWVSYELLPYHRMGEPKYRALGRSYPLGNARLDETRFAELQARVEARRGAWNCLPL